MANVYVDESSLQDIADSIRAKNGTQNTYKPGEMSAAIDAIPSGGAPVINSLSVTENGTYTAPTGVDGYSPITVDVPSVTPTGTKQISITANGTTTEDVSAYASAEITVNVPSSGVTLSGLAYPVIFQTTRSSSVALNRAVYNSSTIMGFARSNVTSSAPVTVNNMLTDGTHVFFNASAGSSITYNGSAADFVKDSTNFMLTIPDGFDGTIPFVIS